MQSSDKKQLTVAVLAFALMTRTDHSGHTPEQCIDEAIPLATRILGLRGDEPSKSKFKLYRKEKSHVAQTIANRNQPVF